MLLPSLSCASSGSRMNDGEARKAYRMASATSAGLPAGVTLLRRMKLVTSASVSGRRKALRPKVLMVVVTHEVVFVVGSQLMNFDLLAPAITSAAISAAAER